VNVTSWSVRASHSIFLKRTFKKTRPTDLVMYITDNIHSMSYQFIWGHVDEVLYQDRILAFED
jgi:hypothetical protein